MKDPEKKQFEKCKSKENRKKIKNDLETLTTYFKASIYFAVKINLNLCFKIPITVSFINI
jgi:hypothetical protein